MEALVPPTPAAIRENMRLPSPGSEPGVKLADGCTVTHRPLARGVSPVLLASKKTGAPFTRSAVEPAPAASLVMAMSRPCMTPLVL
jgi:hypothetical protein